MGILFMRKRTAMPIYRIDHALNDDIWYIEGRDKLPVLHCNIVYPVEIELANGDIIPGKAVWVDQPTPLAAFSHALMLFNGEI